jgi:GT2 family glycosyltransferase
MAPSPEFCTEDQQLLAQVTIVIVTFNSAHCIESLSQSLGDCPHVVVTDNGSQDQTLAELAHRIPRARIISLDDNVGFGAANNRALATVTTPYALLLNPDCVIETTSILALVRTAHNWPEAAMVVPQIQDSREKATINYSWPRPQWKSRGPGAEGLTCVGNACGAVMLLNLGRMTASDWFDTRFFLYYEDEDLCLRLFNKQMSILLEPGIRVTHINRGSVRGRRPLYLEYLRGLHHARSKILFTAKHYGSPAACRHRRSALAQACLTLIPRMLLPSPRLIARLWGRIRGLLDAPTRY